MNVYDLAHDLARAIRESGEFSDFDKLRKEVDQDPESSAMLKEFQELQMQLQAAQFTDSQPDQNVMNRIQSLSTMIMAKPLAARYLQAQGALSVMMNDVFQIIGESISPK